MPRSQALGPRFFRLAAINILSNVTVPLAGLVDTAMLGHLADIRFLAGVALGSLTFDYLYWAFGFLRMGTTGTTAQAEGREDQSEVYAVLYRSMAIGLGIGIGILLLQWPLREIGFGLLSGEPGVEAAGREYFNARIWGAPATLCNFVLVGWYLGREQSRLVLAMTVAANLANVILNYVFIMRLQMAAQGAGLATMLSQYVMLAIGSTIYLRSGPAMPWNRATVFDRGALGQLFRLNFDIFVRTLCLITSFAVFVNFSSILGTAVLAANSLLLRLVNLASYMIDGAAFACESLAGVFHGRGDKRSLQRLIRLSLGTGLCFAGGFLLLVFSAPRWIFGLLTNHDELVRTSISYLPWLIPTLLLGSLAYMYDGLFLGLTRGATLRKSMLFSSGVVFLPIAWIALRESSNHLLWAAMSLFMLARTLTLWLSSRRASDILLVSPPQMD